MTDEDLIHQLRNSKGWPTLGHAAADRIEALRAALDDAEAERHRWRQAAAKGSIHTQADLEGALEAVAAAIGGTYDAQVEAYDALCAALDEAEAKNSKLQEALIHLRGLYDCADVVDAALQETDNG